MDEPPHHGWITYALLCDYTQTHSHTLALANTFKACAHHHTHTQSTFAPHTNTCDDVDIDSLRDALCLYGVSKVKFLCWTVCCAAACWLLVAGRIYTVRARLYALCVCVVASPKIQPRQIHFELRRCARNLRSQNAQQSTMMMLLLFASCCWWCLACRGSVYIVIFMQHFFWMKRADRPYYYYCIISKSSALLSSNHRSRDARIKRCHTAHYQLSYHSVCNVVSRARERRPTGCAALTIPIVLCDNAIYRRSPLGVWNDPTITQICLPRRFLQTKHDSQMILCTYI